MAMWGISPVTAIALLAAFASSVAASEMPPGFVYLRDIDPSIIQDMRYATPDNFTGAKVPGYEAPQCILQREAAAALKRAQDHAKSKGYSLKVYDCYRPVRAVQAFMAWASSKTNDTKRYYPHLAKSQLVPGYIASQSGHSTGASLDLTLVPLSPEAKAPAEGSNADCTAAEPAQRNPDDSIDMGTSFDCFDPKANTASPMTTPQQRRARNLLKSILEPEGFENYPQEWWHFTYTGAKDRRRYDFPITDERGR
jgi:D-alanyl-D-alanine dipeptidase